MIEINLLPGSRKKRGAKGAGFTMPDVKALAGLVKDPWLIACLAAWGIFALVVVLLWLPRRGKVNDLEPQLASVQREAQRLEAVLRTKAEAESKRDSLIAQIEVIRSIDRERYIWPHIMDAVSRALPPYTWLDDLASRSAEPTDSGGAAIGIQITGKSADIQAITRFVRNLEESPFLEQATQMSTSVVLEQNRDIFTFVINVRYQQPDTTILAMRPLAASLVQGYRSGASRR
jgi:Tfp pilus assembly protein PilN